MNGGDITFGQVVKECRHNLGLTQAELGRRVGCAAITIRKIEANALRPSLQIAEQLALALNIPEAEQLAFVRLARADRGPSPLPTPEPIPDEIGREDLTGRAIRGYELGERIGAGGYGVVYQAVQATVTRQVAVKIILPQYANRPEFIRRFEAEAQLVARLEHPHIVPLYDYWREPNVAYLIMRLLRGGSLESRLKLGSLSPELILPLLEQVGAGLHAAHRAGVIHRDIKPANILLDEDGNAYLADFGIAKINDRSHLADMTREGTVLGSPAYISPEQILAEPVKPQADIYSLGVMLYEMLTGRKPFQGPTPVAYIQQHLNEPLPLLPQNGGTSSETPPIPTALDIVIGRATAKDPRQRYPNILTMLADLHQAMTPDASAADLADSQTVGPMPPHVAAMLELPGLENPYKGLRSFTEADAADFFGRDTLIQDLLARLAEANDLTRFLAVVGPSGGGKSSVVRAGLIPALRQGGLPGSEHWFIAELVPGSHPFEELERALLRVAVNPPENMLAQLRRDENGLLRVVQRLLPADPDVELLLLIDQFEELFTLVKAEATRQHFLDSMVTAVLDPDSRLRLVITLRADFTDQPLRYVDFGELVRQRTEFVLPLTPDELEQAIVGPTRRAGLSLEEGLAPAIIRAIGDQPGTLPLLQYALTELFERRKGRLLTLAAYQDSGGVLGALARRAEEIYAGLDESEQELTRQLFLRLVTLGEGTEDTRRRVLRAELSQLSVVSPTGRLRTGQSAVITPGRQSADATDNGHQTIDKVIDQFGRYRLLTFDHDPVTRGPTVEVAHEALLREWGRLREWLDAGRNDIRMQRLLATAAAEWRQANREASFLLRGARLDQFAGWAAGTTLALTPDERTFLEASLADREARLAEEEARRRRELETAQKLAQTEKQAARRLRWLAVGLALFLVVAAGLAVIAFNRQAEAVSNLALSESQRLAAEANAILQGGGNPELAALLSLRALNTAYTAQADMALQLASKRDYGRRLFVGHDSNVVSLAFSPDGRYALSGSYDQTARLWEVDTGRLLQTLTGHTGAVLAVAYSPDGRYLLTGSEDGTARLWDAPTGRLLQTLTGHTDKLEGVSFSPDSRYALTGSWDGTAILWDLQESGRQIRVFQGADDIKDVAFSPDGQFVLTADDTFNEVGLWETATGRKVGRFTGVTGQVVTAAFSPDGRYILACDGDGGVWRWNLGQAQAAPLNFSGHTQMVFDIDVSPDGRYLVSASGDNSVRLWDIETGQELRRYVNSTGNSSIAFAPDGQTFLVGSYDFLIRQWAVQPPPDPRTFRGHTNVIDAATFSPDGRYLLTGSRDTTARLWNVDTGQEIYVFGDHTDWVQGVAFAPDGRYALTGSLDGSTHLWDVQTGEEVRAWTQPTYVFQAAYSPDGRLVATANRDNTVRLWNIETGQEVRTFTGHTDQVVGGVVFSPDGRYLLSGSDDGTARLWEVETGREVRRFPDHFGEVNGLAYSPDGNYILTPFEHTLSQLWDLRESGPALRRFSGNSGAFSPDGKYIATGGPQNMAFLWDRATGRQLRAFGAVNNVRGVAFSPDSRYVLVFGADRVAQLWDIDYQVLADSVCARVLRDFTEGERAEHGIDDQQPTCPTKN